MNRENIHYTIDLLKDAQNFKIRWFQRNPGAETYVTTIEELHACGNTACIAGYVALSPLWRQLGGGIDRHGCPEPPPEYESENTSEAFSKFWGISERAAEAIIYGEEFEGFCHQHNIGGMPDSWYDMTKENAAWLFKQLLANTDSNHP